MIQRRSFLKIAGASAGLAALDPSRAAAAGVSVAPQSELRAQRLSWAGVRLELGDMSLLIDPWTSTRIWEGAWTREPVPLEVTTAQRHVLITHLHNDHFDPPAIEPLLAERGYVVCHESVAAWVASRGFRVRPVALHEPVLLGDYTVTAVPAVDGLGEHQVSWIVRGGGRRIIHCGDTLWHGQWWHIAGQYGPFDAAFLPINGPRIAARTPASGIAAAMTPEQAVAAAAVLGATLAIPIHYGMVGRASYVEHPDAEAEFLAVARERDVPVDLVPEGGWVTWADRP